MSWLGKTLSSYPGRKMLAGLTGLGLVAFLVIHLLGNLQLFLPSDAFNEYAHSLHAGPLIVLGDIGLLVAIPLHIAMVVWLARGNRAARGDQGYKVVATKQKRSLFAVLAGRWTLYTGLIILAFVAIHVWQFRLHHDAISTGAFGDGVAAGDLKAAVIATLKKPHWAILYVLGSLATAYHLFHGIQAAFRSLGFYHNRYTPLIVKGGALLAIILGLGFASMPLWALTY